MTHKGPDPTQRLSLWLLRPCPYPCLASFQSPSRGGGALDMHEYDGRPINWAARKTSIVSRKKKRGRPPTGVKEPWKELNISKATYYRRIRLL